MCVKAKGKEMGHGRGKKGDRDLPAYSWGFCFPGDELGFKWTVLVGKERMSGSWMAQTIPTLAMQRWQACLSSRKAAAHARQSSVHRELPPSMSMEMDAQTQGLNACLY